MIDVDGSNLHALTANSSWEEYPKWSPDGTQISFLSDRDSDVEIYVMNADGSDQRRLTNSQGSDTEAAWSPDGTQIVYLHQGAMALAKST